MDSSTEKKRNISVDVFRSIAMLLVIMGHTLSGSTLNYESTFLFNIIWTLQMPLFMIISGYVTKYYKPISGFKSLLEYIKKRSFSYLLPWLVWTVVVRGIIFRDTFLLDPVFLFWHMDAGYWFLTSLWTITMMFGIGQLLANRINKNEKVWSGSFFTILFSCVSAIPIIVLATFLGFNFFGIKLSLYYTPFFLIGFLFSKVKVQLSKSNRYKTIIDCIVLLCSIIYFSIIARVNVALLEDNLVGIAIRAFASITGCITVFGFGYCISKDKPLARDSYFDQPKMHGGIMQDNKSLRRGCDDCMQTQKSVESVRYKFSKSLSWIGRNTLGIYLVHSKLLCIIKIPEKYELSYFPQFILVFTNFILTILLCCFTIWCLDHLAVCRKIFLGKK